MQYNNDIEWLKRASKLWAEQNKVISERIQELTKQKWQLQNKEIRSIADEKQIIQISKEIGDLIKQMEHVDCPKEAEGGELNNEEIL